jgi:methylase of polypeptide subunit release factors
MERSPRERAARSIMGNSANEFRLWQREYSEINSIPSSQRTTPSKALVAFEPLIPFKQSFKVLDAGCGNGRNAIHLASKVSRIIAADLSTAALSSVVKLANSTRFPSKINPIRLACTRFG